MKKGVSLSNNKHLINRIMKGSVLASASMFVPFPILSLVLHFSFSTEYCNGLPSLGHRTNYDHPFTTQGLYEDFALSKQPIAQNIYILPTASNY